MKTQEDFHLTPQEGFALAKALTSMSVKLLSLAALTPHGELFDQYMALIEDAQSVLNPIAERIMEEIGE